MQLKIDALREAAAWPGADQRTPVVPASQLVAQSFARRATTISRPARTARPPPRSRWRSTPVS